MKKKIILKGLVGDDMLTIEHDFDIELKVAIDVCTEHIVNEADKRITIEELLSDLVVAEVLEEHFEDVFVKACTVDGERVFDKLIEAEIVIDKGVMFTVDSKWQV